MSNEKKTPEKKNTADIPVETREEPNRRAAPKPSPKKTVNIFMVVVLLLIAGGIYLHQNGYINKYYPLVKSKLSPNNTFETDLIPTMPEEVSAPTKTSHDLSFNASETNTPEPRALVSSPEEHPEIAVLQDRLQKIEEKIATLENNAPTTSPSGTSEIDKAFLKTFSNLQDLQQKIYQGLPFSGELNALKILLSPEDSSALEEFSPVGVPTLVYLINDFKKVARLLDQEEAFQNATTILQKGQAFLGQLVHLEKTSAEGNETPSKARIYETRLRQGDISGIIQEVEALKKDNEMIALWLAHAKAYETTHRILTRTKQSFLTATN